MPVALAIVAATQWVASAGGSLSVRATTRSHDPIGADAISAVQYDPCAPNMLLGDVAVPDERLQTTTVGRAQDDADSWAHEPDSHTENPAGIPLGIQMSDFIH